MFKESSVALLASATLLVTAAFPAGAQEAKRTELKRADLTGTNMEVIMAVLEAPPGVTVPRHFHHGEESFYVLEGATVETPDGKRQELKTGFATINAREVPHGGVKVVGDRTLKAITTHIVDKGKPLNVLVGQ